MPFVMYAGWYIGLWLRVRFEASRIDKEWEAANG